MFLNIHGFSYIFTFYHASVECMNSRVWHQYIRIIKLRFYCSILFKTFSFLKKLGKAVDRCISIDKMLPTFNGEREWERKKREKYLLYYNRWGTLKKLINNPIKQIETFSIFASFHHRKKMCCCYHHMRTMLTFR